MPPRVSPRTLAAVVVFSSIVLPLWAAPPIDRRIEQTFRAAGDSIAVVRISGGPIRVETGGSGSLTVTLTTRIDASSEARADEILSAYELEVSQRGEEVRVVGRRRRDSSGSWGRNDRVRISATLTVPSNVRLDLGTSGGSIAVSGARAASLKADTSGGSIEVDGGAGALDLDTSGGAIRVARALSRLRADTSGGEIVVQHVGRSADDIVLDTSGGGIRVGVDPEARLDFTASTSGGSVSIEGLTFEARSISKHRASGTLNGGGGRLTASTSGGSIEIRADRR